MGRGEGEAEREGGREREREMPSVIAMVKDSQEHINYNYHVFLNPSVVLGTVSQSKV